MANQVVPLNNQPTQTFEIALAVAGKTVRLNLTFRYNEMAGYWFMTIANQFKAVLLDSVPLLTGTWPAANILAQYQYLGIGSCYLINIGNAPMDYPNNTNLGTDFILIWSDPTV